MDPTPPDERRPRPLHATAGILAAAFGLGVAELLAAIVTSWSSPVVAVGDRVVELAPPALAAWAIDTFGTADKPALIAGTLVLLTLGAAGLGVLAARRLGLALLGVAAFGVVGVTATLASPATGLGGAAPALAAAALAAVALVVLTSGLHRRPALEVPGPAGDALGALSRRRFLELATVVGLGAAATATAGRFLVAGFDVDAARRALALPEPVQRRNLPIPADAHPGVEGLSPFLTPNDDFYRIDINLTLPRIDPDTHVLRVHGMVDRELRIPLRDLLARELVEIPITMTCVSYEIGGDLVGTAAWRGIPLRELLDEAGVHEAADQIVGRSVDGYTGGFPLAAAYDRDALVVVGMNGEPLPLEHGFPLRLVTPGIYGYVGATKWLQEIELTRFDAFDQYWVPRGYDAQAPIETMSRIDVPSGLAQLDAGETVVAGVAWAQTRGVRRVEVQVDDEDWAEAELSPAVNDVTWVPWTFRWQASPGRHTLRVRATDETGEVQTDRRRGVRPNGATGQHGIVVQVRDSDA
ncbi:molybdopterin-dependent oxidoreductase [Nitriliruptoraceae bacterium ZYF776]|nr:molybdopterin-dependent oxidoreductase [Profundirhabdus halotolerans]